MREYSDSEETGCAIVTVIVTILMIVAFTTGFVVGRYCL